MTEKAKKGKELAKCQCLTITKIADKVYAESCGGKTNKKFVPGHDARTKSTLQQAFRAGLHIHVDGADHTATAMAKHYGYERYLTEKKAAKKKTYTVVKVGRWEYPIVKCVATADGFHVTYSNRENKHAEVDVTKDALK